jgi:replicative DNA helicase
MNRQLLGHLLTTESLFLDYCGKLEGLRLIQGDWTVVNWVILYRKEKNILPTWEELKVKFPDLPVKEVLDKVFVEQEIMRFVRDESLKSWIINVANDIDKGLSNYGKVFSELKSMSELLDFQAVEGSNISVRYKEVIDLLSTPELHVRVQSGIKGLDKVLDGGFGKGEIVIAIAPPGIGKTTFLLNSFYGAISARKHALLISAELSELRLLERLYRRISKSTKKDVRVDAHKVKERLERFFRYIKTSGLILYKRPYSWSVMDIGLYIDKLRSKGIEIDILFVDYMDKMKPSNKGDYRLALRDLTEDMRYLAIEKNIAVVTATQANRAALSAITVTEEHVAESFGKVEVADVVLSMGRTQKDEEKGTGRLVMLKNREGRGKGIIIPISLDLDRCTMEDLI